MKKAGKIIQLQSRNLYQNGTLQIGEILNKLRERKGVSRNEVSLKTGIKPETLYNYEHNRSRLSFENASLLAQYYEICIWDLANNYKCNFRKLSKDERNMIRATRLVGDPLILQQAIKTYFGSVRSGKDRKRIELIRKVYLMSDIKVEHWLNLLEGTPG